MWKLLIPPKKRELGFLISHIPVLQHFWAFFSSTKSFWLGFEPITQHFIHFIPCRIANSSCSAQLEWWFFSLNPLKKKKKENLFGLFTNWGALWLFSWTFQNWNGFSQQFLPLCARWEVEIWEFLTDFCVPRLCHCNNPEFLLKSQIWVGKNQKSHPGTPSTTPGCSKPLPTRTILSIIGLSWACLVLFVLFFDGMWIFFFQVLWVQCSAFHPRCGQEIHPRLERVRRTSEMKIEVQKCFWCFLGAARGGRNLIQRGFVHWKEEKNNFVCAEEPSPPAGKIWILLEGNSSAAGAWEGFHRPWNQGVLEWFGGN